MNWNEAMGGVGGGVLASIVAWFLGRTDGAAARREKETRTVVGAVLSEARTEARLAVLESSLPRIETDVRETKDLVRSTNDKLDELLLSGRLDIRRKDRV